MSKKVKNHQALILTKKKAEGVTVTQSTVAEGVTVTMTHIDHPTTFLFDVENVDVSTAYTVTLDITQSVNMKFDLMLVGFCICCDVCW